MSSWFQPQLEALRAQHEAFKAALLQELEKESDAQNKLALIEFGSLQAEKIENLFRQAVQEWYDSYSPSLYGRGYSLFDVLDISFTAEGLVNDEPIESLYNSGVAIGDGRYGGLFNVVFKEGWHGGDAASHRYRTPPPYYTRWGRVAARSTSADSLFKDKMSGAEGELFADFKRISDARQAQAVAKVQAMVGSLQAQYFG